MTEKIVIDEILNDPTISDWLKCALRSALNRDALDATNDAEILFLILSTRLVDLFAESTHHAPAQNECVPL